MRSAMTNTIDDSEYVSVREACEILGVCRATLDNYARAGRLERYELGAPIRTRYKWSELNLLKRTRPKYHQLPYNAYSVTVTPLLALLSTAWVVKPDRLEG